VHHITVQNSIIRKFGCGGVVALKADYIVIRNNQIYENAWYSRYGCSGATIFPLNQNPNDTNVGYRNIVENNVMWNNRGKVKWLGKPGGAGYSDGNGFILDISATDDLGKEFTGRTLIRNNLVVNNGGSGIHAYDSRRADIVNNTAYKNGDAVNYPDIYANTGNDVKIFNNVVYARPQASGGKINSNSNSNNVNVVYNYNVYYMENTTGKPLAIAANTQGADDKIADPQFVNPTTDPATWDFSLKPTSPAINSGYYQSGFTPETDILGTTRITSSIDRGAYEASKPYITSARSFSGTTNVDLEYHINASNAPTAYAATSLPTGLTINTSTGLISGKPTAAGPFNTTVSATNGFGTTTVSVPFTITDLPAGWGVSSTTPVGGKLESINSPDGKKWTVVARTNRLVGSNDSYAAAWQSVPVNGDIVIRAKVINNTDDSTLSAAGVSIRETEGADSIHVSTLVSPLKGVTYVRRTKTTGKTAITAGPNDSSDVYVEIKRVGDVITSSASVDGGKNWTVVRTETVVLKNPVRVGLITTSSGSSKLNTATFDDVTIIKQ
jgi:hypothetical protein